MCWIIVLRISIIVYHTSARMSASGPVPSEWMEFVHPIDGWKNQVKTLQYSSSVILKINSLMVIRELHHVWRVWGKHYTIARAKQWGCCLVSSAQLSVGLADHIQCVNMRRWPSQAPGKWEKKRQICEKGLDPNLVLQPELTSVVCLDIYITLVSTICKPFSVHRCSCVCSHVCGCMSMYVCLPEVSIGCLPQSFSTLCFENKVSWWTWRLLMGRLVGQKALGTSCVCLAMIRVTDRHHCTWLFTWVLGGLHSDSHAYMTSSLLTGPSAQPLKPSHYTKNVKMFIYLVEG